MIDATNFAQPYKNAWGLAVVGLPPELRMGHHHAQIGHAILLPVPFVPHELPAVTVRRGLQLGADSVGCVYDANAWRMLGAPMPHDVARVALGQAHGLHTAMAVCIGARQHVLVRAADEQWMRNDAEHAVKHVAQVLRLRHAEGAWVFCGQRFALPKELLQTAVTLHGVVHDVERDGKGAVQLQQRLLQGAPAPSSTCIDAQRARDDLHQWQQHRAQDSDGLKLTPLPSHSAQHATRATARVAWRVQVPSATEHFVVRGCVRLMLPSGWGVEVEAFAQGPWCDAEKALAQMDAVLAGVQAPP